jgi:hypothetical protein
MYANHARAEAFAFAWQHRNELACIEERLQEKEEIASSKRQSNPTGSLTSVDAYQEGSIAGLKDALHLQQTMTPTVNEGANPGSEETLAQIVYRTILESEAKSSAAGFTWKHIDNLDEIRNWTHVVESAKPEILLVKLKELVIDTGGEEKVDDEETLRKSLSQDAGLSIYYHAYLDILKQVLQKAQQLSIESEIEST